MKKAIKWILIVLLGLVVLGAIIGGGDKDEKTPVADAPQQETKVAEEQKKEEAPATETKTEEKPEEKKEEAPTEPGVSKEFENALKKAKNYAETMHMSKKGIYNQLTSEYGENFPAEAAQYAVDNLEWDYKENAYKKAKNYQDTMSMSINSVKEQLTSEYGEQFTEEEAQYAIDKLKSEQ